MSQKLVDLLSELGTNSGLQAQFFVDPEAFLKQQELADEERNALLNQDLMELDGLIGNSEILCINIAVPSQDEPEREDDDDDKEEKGDDVRKAR